MGISINNLSYGLKDFFESGGGSISGNTPKDTAKKLAELQQVADRSGPINSALLHTKKT